MPPNIISNQRDLLQAMANSGVLYQLQSRNTENSKRQWWLRKKNYHVRVLLSTGDAAQRHGHIEPEPTGLYWKLTHAGQAHLDYMNWRISKGKKLPKEYTR